MSYDPSLDTAVAVSGQVAASTMANKTQRDINKANQEYNAQMLETQRQWALDDWAMVQKYNDPRQQMQRYMDAGLNPHLIYGSAANSPAAMVRSTAQNPHRDEAGGIIKGAEIYGNVGQTLLNSRMAVQQLENDTNLKNAQILNLKSQSDKNEWSNKVTEKAFDDIVNKIQYETSTAYQNFLGKTADVTNKPTDEMVHKRYNADTQRTLELIELAKKEGKLKQVDIDMIEKLQGLKGGPQMINDLLKIILAASAKRAFN